MYCIRKKLKEKNNPEIFSLVCFCPGDADDRNCIVKNPEGQNGGVSLHHASAVNENPDDYDFSIPVERRCGQFSRAGRWH